MRSGLTCSCRGGGVVVVVFFKRLLLHDFEFFFETVHLIRSDVSEQSVAIVQTTSNLRTHQMSSSFPRQEIANRANSSDLKIR